MKAEASFNDLSDNALAGMLREGNEPAFVQLYKRHSERLYLNMLKMVKDEQVAEELVQELFTKVWLKKDELNIESNFLAYLYRIAQNLVHDFFRKLNRDKKLYEHVTSIAVSHYEHIEQALHDREMEGLLVKALDQLSPQQRNVYQYCKIEGDTYKQAAEKLGISVHTVKEYLIKANKEVKNFLLSDPDIVFSLLFYLILKDKLK